MPIDHFRLRDVSYGLTIKVVHLEIFFSDVLENGLHHSHVVIKTCIWSVILGGTAFQQGALQPRDTNQTHLTEGDGRGMRLPCCLFKFLVSVLCWGWNSELHYHLRETIQTHLWMCLADCFLHPPQPQILCSWTQMGSIPK